MKKSLPLSLIQVISEIAEKIKGETLAFDKNNKFFKVYDTEEGSTFFFEVTGVQARDANLAVTFVYSPVNRHIIKESSRTEWVKEVLPSFEGWLALVEAYQEVKTPFDDPIIERYEREFFAEFELVDDDADEVGFDYPIQLRIDGALSGVIEVLESKRDEKNTMKVDALIADIETIKESLTELTKTETVNKISSLFAKIRKGGMKLIQDTYPILQKEIIGQVVKKVLELGSHPNLPNVIDILQ